MLVQFLKKFFIIAIFLSFTCCQVTFASNKDIPVDWSKVQKISSKSDLAVYLENSRRRGQTTIPVILSEGLTVSADDLIHLSPSSLITYYQIESDWSDTKMIYEFKDYPGTKVANAYRNGDTSKLNQDEMKLYLKAVAIINEANKKSIWQQQEVYIYNTIAKSTTYESVIDFNHQPRPCTAIGVFLDGKANCQGYSDAFYMLCRMLGWNVGRMSGDAGGGHMWNTISIDGKIYCVDVTWGDSSIEFPQVNKTFNSYIYFNAPIEIMQVTHSWRADLAPANMKGSIDHNYAYNVYSNLGRASNGAAGIKLLAKKLTQTTSDFASIIIPYDEKYSTNPKNWAYFDKEIKALGFKKKWWLYTQNHGKYIFVTAIVY